MKSLKSVFVFATLLMAIPTLHAQLVADGATNTLANVTNSITGSVTVGTNGSFTLLVLSNNCLVTNTTSSAIGLNATAKSNEVRLVSPSARWQMGSFLSVGSDGAMNRLVVSNGASVFVGTGSRLGFNFGSGSNSVLVTGIGSLWTNRGSVIIGYQSAGNQMVISNGGAVMNQYGSIGESFGGSSNLVVVSGSGSTWSNQLDLAVGYGSGDRLVVEAGASVSCSNAFIGATAGISGPNGASDEVLLTGPGSLWTVRAGLAVGSIFSGGNSLVVSNGAAVVSASATTGGAGNQVVVTGSGSVWSNQFDLLMTGTSDRLEVRAGGSLSASNSTIGSLNNSNTVLITGAGSLWNNQGNLALGNPGNSIVMIASNGATVLSSNAFIGSGTSLGNNNLALLTGAGTMWSNRGDFYVGFAGSGNKLTVSNGAIMSALHQRWIGLGSGAASQSNTVTVTGIGSRWSGINTIFMGSNGGFNQLVISSGGQVSSGSGHIGYGASGSNNTVTITGTDSLWDTASIYLGESSVGNRLIVSNAAVALSSVGSVGTLRDNNEAIVTGTGSLWTNNFLLEIGNSGKFNRLVLTNGGAAGSGGQVTVGSGFLSAGNSVIVDGGTLRVTNSSGTGVLDVRRGTNVFNAGLIEADNLLVTNAAGSFQFNGGTLVTRGANITQGLPFALGQSAPAIWNLSGGNHFIAGHLIVGNATPMNQMIITNGAVLTNSGLSYIGNFTAASSNAVYVSGGSKWRMGGSLTIGGSPFNRLEVSDGGEVIGSDGNIGVDNSNNLVVVTGSGSLWSNATQLAVGYSGKQNQLVVSNGATVRNAVGYIGTEPGGSNNLAVITDPGSLWSMTGDLDVGLFDSRNQLVVSNGASVSANDVVLGFTSSSLNNRLTVAGGGFMASSDARVGNASGSNVAVVAGAGSVWSNAGSFYLGISGAGNQLIVSNGATLSVGGAGGLGVNSGANSNSAVIAGPGTSWRLGSDFCVGSNGAFNVLIVSNGAVMANFTGSLGNELGASNNVAVVTGVGSLWTNSVSLAVGYRDGQSQLVVSNGGVVADVFGYLGFSPTADNNVAMVTGAASAWSNRQSLVVGLDGANNLLVVSNGGLVFANDGLTVGLADTSLNNRVVVNGGTLRATNAAGTGVLDVRRGTFELDAGLVEGDQLRLTNLQASFNFPGGTLITRGGALKGLTLNGGATWDVRAGVTTHVISNAVIVGGTSSFNTLLITNGGQVTGPGYVEIGNSPLGKTNRMVVSGAGSGCVLGSFTVGVYGEGNSLVVSNGASLIGTTADGDVGFYGSNSLATVTGAGSLWSNTFAVDIGVYSAGNRLVISNGAGVVGRDGWLGYLAAPEIQNNEAVVTGTGSYWKSRADLSVGYGGNHSRLLVTDGGTINSSNLFIGYFPLSSGSRMVVDGGNVFVTNAARNGMFDVRRGTNQFDAGLINADILLVTNAPGQFEFNGGTLVPRATTHSNGRVFTVGNGTSVATLQLLGGIHSFANGLLIASNAVVTGSGTIGGTLFVAGGGTISPGDEFGVLTLSNSPTLNGTLLMEVFKIGATKFFDQIQVAAPLFYDGTLVVSNVGVALNIGDNFKLFSAANYLGSFSSMILPPLSAGLGWTNKLLVDGSIEVVNVNVSQPGVSSISVSGTNMIISGTNGIAGQNYAVLTATNITTPLANWLSLKTNQFGVGGVFSFTNPISPGELQRYFRIRTP